MAEPRDEMVDGNGGLRPPWRQLHTTLTSLGREVLADRARQLDRIFAEEGLTGLLPGAAPVGWRCDPIPLPLGSEEFATLAAGLAQRAQLLEAVLADVHGKQELLAEGVLPPALVYANPAFVRACRSLGAAGLPASRAPRLQFYAAELLRDADGQWRVLADRTADAAGTAYALENRRALSRVVPELFRGHQLRQLGSFFETWQDALQRLAPAGGGNPGLALLTPGPADKLWFEHVVLARELSCALVEGGDLTVREGALYLKTLRGLSRVDVLLRRQDGRRLDPLELESGPARGGGSGIPGLLDAMREGAVRVVNDPSAGFAEAPALAAFMPRLARRLLGEDLLLPDVGTLWLGDAEARARVLATLPQWRIRPAFDGTETPVVPSQLPPQEAEALAARIARHGMDYVAQPLLVHSVAPCQSAEGKVPRPVVLRMFLLFDGRRWQAMPGGLARVLTDQDALAGRLPLHALSKDVWVPAEELTEILGPSQLSVPALPIRRAAGDLPSRVGDNFWLGRYLERLEGSARLLRLAIAWLERPTPTPRELAELHSLMDCLGVVGLVDAEAVKGLGSDALARILRQVAREGGPLAVLMGELSRLSELMRDRLTNELHATFSQSLRSLAITLRKASEPGAGLGPLAQATGSVIAFAATVAGLAAENMVRGGGRLFLDLGRRVERAKAIATELACVLDQPGGLPSRLEPGLRLALELRDSVITYRSRYLTVLQPAPVLDLVLADEGNPRGLAFQLAAARDMLAELGGGGESSLAVAAGALLEEAQAMVRDVLAAPQQASAALALPPRLRALAEAVAQLSDRIGRRYFALLPAVRSVGLEGETRRLQGHGVIYRVRHTTRYAYRTPVDLGAHMLHLQPRVLPWQRVLSTGLEITPAPARRHDGVDHFGNKVSWLFLDLPHPDFSVTTDAVVDVGAPPPPPAEATLPWEQVVEAARHGGPGAWQAAEFTFGSPRGPAHAGAGAYIAPSFAPGRPVLEGLLELNSRIRRDFTFRSGVTTLSTSIDEVLAKRQGVCQDFTQLMIAGLRALGLPARYTSGYIRTRPPPGQTRRRGSDQSHAWVGCWLGPQHGWVDLDPTNDVVISDEHVVLGWGRDYGDVSPLRGVILGGGSHSLSVSVDLQPL